MDLDRARSRPRERGGADIPLVYEAVELSPGVRRAGWAAVVALVAAAITLAFRFSAGPGEMAGGLLAALGVVLAFVLARCRRFETTVGTNRLETRVGLAHRKLPLGMVSGVSEGPATSWRRAYADREVRLEVAGSTHRIPSREPEELLEVLGVSGGRGSAPSL